MDKTRRHRLGKTSFCLCLPFAAWILAGLLFSGTARAGEDEQPTYKWVDERGAFLELPAAFHTQWVWKKTEDSKPGAPSETPALRIWIDTPAAALSDLKPQDPSLAPLDAGPPPFEPRGEAHAIDVRPGKLSEGLTFSLKIGKEGRLRTLSLVAISESETPTQLVHPGCGALGIRMREKLQPGFSYTALSCEDAGDRIRLVWQHSPEIKVTSGALGKPESKGENWQAFGVAKAQLESEAGRGKILGSLALTFKRGGQGRAEVTYESPVKRFSFSPGVGLSFVRYSEPFNRVELSQLGVTAKATGIYSLLPGKLSADLTAYLTLLPLTLSPSGLSPARFFGVNARAGYRLPLRSPALQLQAMLGYYMWGMWVPDRAYGVNLLFGPQFQVVFRYQRPVSRAYFGYLKFAPLVESLASLSLGNSELATGAGFQLSSPSAKRIWNLTGDFSWTRFAFADGINSLRLATFSLGLQTVFN